MRTMKKAAVGECCPGATYVYPEHRQERMMPVSDAAIWLRWFENSPLADIMLRSDELSDLNQRKWSFEMLVGVPKEIKPDEYRVAMMPVGVELMVKNGHQVFVETQAGVGSGFTD